MNQNWKTNEWSAEYDQTWTGIHKVKMWAGLGEDDVMISASVDEVLDRAVLSQLRWCELANDVTFGALWMPMGRFDNALKVDNPSKLGPHLHMQPTIYRWAAIAQGREAGQRLGCNEAESDHSCGHSLRGGVHLTNGAFLPNTILKEFTATEENYYAGSVNWNLLFSADTSRQTLNLEQDRIYKLQYRPMFLDKSDPVAEATDLIPKIPYYLSCNRERFPYWFGHPDKRNGDFLDKIKQFKEMK